MKKKSNQVLKSISFTLMMVLFTGAGYFVGAYGMKAADAIPGSTVMAMAVLFLPAFFLVIGIHEGGHAWAGIRVGFDFRMYVVGPFMWNKEQGVWKFSWNKNVNTMGGMVICLPTDTSNISKRFSTYAAGGPLASLLLTGLAYGLFQFISVLNNDENTGLQILAYFFLMMAFLSMVIFLVTAIPMHFGGFSSDGARVLRFLRGGDKARFEGLLLKIIAGSSGGIRPSLLDLEELNEAKVLADKLNAPFGVYLHSFFYQVAFDRGDMDAAEKHLQDYIGEVNEIPQGLKGMVYLDAAFFYAFVRKDIQQAMHYWEQFKPAAMIPKAMIHATEAAIAALNEEDALMRLKIESSLKELPNMIDQGLAVVLKEKLQELQGQSST